MTTPLMKYWYFYAWADAVRPGSASAAETPPRAAQSSAEQPRAAQMQPKRCTEQPKAAESSPEQHKDRPNAAQSGRAEGFGASEGVGRG